MLGAEIDHRIAHLAQVLSGARAGDFDGAPLREPRDHDLPERGPHPGLREPLVREATCPHERVGARHEAAGLKDDPRLGDPRVDHVVRLAVAADRGHPDACRPLRQLPQDRGQRLGLAGVLRQPDQRQSPRRGDQLRQRRGGRFRQHYAAAVRAASSRTMKLATWYG